MSKNKLNKIVTIFAIFSAIFIFTTNSWAKEDPVLLSHISQQGYTPGQLSLLLCDGPVYFKSYNGDIWQKCRIHQTFTHGDSLRTGNHGYAVVAWSADNIMLIKPKSSMRFAIQPQLLPQVVVQLHKATLMLSARDSGLIEIEGKNGSLVVNHGETSMQSNDNHEIIKAVKGQAAFRMVGTADSSIIPEATFLKFDNQGKDFPITNFDPQIEYESFRRFSNFLNRFADLHQFISSEISYSVDSVRINGKFLSNTDIGPDGFYIIDNGDGNILKQIHLQLKISPYPRPEDHFELYINKDLAYAFREGQNGYHEVVFSPPSIPDFFIAVHSTDSLGRKIRIFKSKFTVLNRNAKIRMAKEFCSQFSRAFETRDQIWLKDHISRDYRDWQGNTYFDYVKMLEDTLRTYRDIRLFIHPFRYEYKDNKILIHLNYRLSALNSNWTFRFEDRGTDVLTIKPENGFYRIISKVSGLLFKRMAVATDLRMGILKGRIIDELGKRPLSGVQVSLGNTKYTTTTNSMGEYVFYNIPPGTYDIKFKKNGYGELTATKVTVKASGEQFK